MIIPGKENSINICTGFKEVHSLVSSRNLRRLEGDLKGRETGEGTGGALGSCYRF